MLDRYWRELTAAAGIIVALGIGLAVNYYFEGVHQREAAADSRSRYADYQAVCEQLVPPGPMRPECLIEKAKAEHAEQHAEADLRAQLDNSSWTFSLMLLGIGGLVLSGAGVVLVYLNLQAFKDDIANARLESDAADARFQKQLDRMREANAITRVNGEAQSRCYPSILNVRVTFDRSRPFNAIQPLDDPEPESDDTLWPIVHFSVRNFGNSPARDVQYHFSVKYSPYFVDRNQVSTFERQSARRFPFVSTDDNSWGASVPAGESIPFATVCRFRLNETERRGLACSRGTGGLSIVLVIALRYRDVFGKTITEDHCFIADISNERRNELCEMSAMPIIFFETQAELRRIRQQRAVHEQ